MHEEGRLLMSSDVKLTTEFQPLETMSADERVLHDLRKQIKEIEEAKARDVRARQLQEEAESIRRQLRSWGIRPVA
jgi:hypothetical protein